MITEIKKWGNSLAIRIPAYMIQALKLNEGSKVQLEESDGYIKFQPLQENEYDLDTLLAQIDESELYDEIDSGDSVGMEL